MDLWFVFMTVLELFILWLSGWLANSVSDDIHNAVSFEQLHCWMIARKHIRKYPCAFNRGT